jgi:F-type H+-transporting ATPase subunit b
MLIDWFTVVAQCVNFLVLVWLLKRYLYGPVLAAIDARERRLALTIADAAANKAAAEQERAAFAAKNAALDGERTGLRKQAATAAEAERVRLVAQAHAEADALRVAQATALRDEQAHLNQRVAGLVTQEVLAIARKVLGDLADASLEERMVARFTQRLRTLDGPAKQSLSAALASPSDVTIRSAFDLSDAQRTLIQNAVDQEFAAAITLRFETAADALCGVELTAGGQQLAWSVTEYLGVLERKMAAIRAAEHAVPTS